MDEIAKLIRCGLLGRKGYPGVSEAEAEAKIDARRVEIRALLAQAPARPTSPRIIEVSSRPGNVPSGPIGVAMPVGTNDEEVVHVRKRAHVSPELQQANGELALIRCRTEQAQAAAAQAQAATAQTKAREEAATFAATAALNRAIARDDYVKRVISEFNVAARENIHAARGAAHAALFVAYADVIVDPKERTHHIRRMLALPKPPRAPTVVAPPPPVAVPTTAAAAQGVRVGAYVMGSHASRYRYVGGSTDIDARVRRHMEGSGTGWTAVYQLTMELPTLTPRLDNPFAWEEEEYYANVADYGVDFVRGGPYPAMQLSTETRSTIIVACVARINLCYHCGRRGHFASTCRATTYGPILDGAPLTGPIKPK